MYRLLIVDDEPFIVDGLKHLFMETDIELELFTAYSVKEAMKHVTRGRIDIVISDMRMPQKSGLQFIDELQTFWPQCRIIFLSGYDEFDYVYHAMKRNIDGYILKTEDDEVLIETVKKSIKKIEEGRTFLELVKTTERKFQEMIPIVKGSVLEALTKGEHLTNISKKTIIDKGAFNIDLDNQWFTIVGKTENVKDLSSKGEELHNLYYIQSLFMDNIHKDISVEFFIFEHRLAVWFIQPKTIDSTFFKNGTIKWTILKKYIQGFLENVQDNYLRLMQTKISFVIGDTPVSRKHIHHHFGKIKQSIKMMSYYTDEMILVDLGKENPLYHEEAKAVAHHFWKKDLHRLQTTITEGKHIESLEIVHQLSEKVFYSHQYSNIVKTEFIYAISTLIMGFLNNKNIHDYFLKENKTFIENKLRNFPIMINTKEEIDYFVKKTCDYQLTKKEQGKDHLISFVNEYIRNNIARNLSLTTIAQVVHFNPSYLSRLYKEQTGINISDYIHQFKIDMAKYYLTETDMFIQLIAEKLGFSSPSYFTLFFRKSMNKSPQDYRNNQWQ